MKQLTNRKEEFIFGIHPVMEAIRSGKSIDRIYIRKSLRGEGFRELFQLIRELEIPFQYVPVEKLNRLSHQNHQGIIGWVSEIHYQKLEDLLPGIYEEGRTPLLLILDRITDVRNLGAIARTAVCAGVDAMIIPAQGAAMINSEAIKTSAGALYSIPVCRFSKLADAIRLLSLHGIQTIAATEKSSVLYTSQDYSLPTALLLGSEGEGIASDLLKIADALVSIPLEGTIGSLNVSVAAGVFLFEMQRQRKPCTS